MNTSHRNRNNWIMKRPDSRTSLASNPERPLLDPVEENQKDLSVHIKSARKLNISNAFIGPRSIWSYTDHEKKKSIWLFIWIYCNFYETQRKLLKFCLVLWSSFLFCCWTLPINWLKKGDYNVSSLTKKNSNLLVWEYFWKLTV